MAALGFVVPGRLSELTGSHLFDRHIVDGLRAGGHAVEVVELDPHRDGDPLAMLPEGSAAAIDGAAVPALAGSLSAAAARLCLVAFVHHPLSDEAGLPQAELRRLAALERAMLPLFRGILCPSRRSAEAVAALGISPERIAVAPPGTAKPASPPRRDGPVRRLLYVANVIPRKGHAVLVDALARLRDLEWSLDCIGSLERDPDAAGRLRERIAAAGLADRIRLLGEKSPAAVRDAYRAADAFVSASLHEGYGMACAEAMAWGLPQVATAAGAVAEVVPPEAGLLVPPGDAGALATALRALIEDAALAGNLAAGARHAAAALPDWPEAVGRWAAAFDRFAGQADPQL